MKTEEIDEIIKEAERWNRVFYYQESIREFRKAVEHLKNHSKSQSKELSEANKRIEELEHEKKDAIDSYNYMDQCYQELDKSFDASCDLLRKKNKENTQLKERVKELEGGIEKGIESLKSKHKAWLGKGGQKSRDDFKLGLSWGWGAFEDLLTKY